MSAHPNPAPPLELDAVTVGYDRAREPVLRSLQLRLDPSGLTVLGGRNGTGKSTVLEVAAGYLRPWSGNAWVAGLPAGSEGARRHRLVCRTTPALYPAMSVIEHLELASLTRGVELGAAVSQAERLGLGAWRDRVAGELSTGNVRKLWLTMCLLGEAPLVVLDEPFNGLDAASVSLVVDDLHQRARSAAVLLIAHRPPEGLAPTRVIDLEDVVAAPPGVGSAASAWR